jgi:hypothetical protein
LGKSWVSDEFVWDLPQFQTEIMPKILVQFDKRDKAFNEARRFLQDSSTSSLDQHEDWAEAHQKQATEQIQAFLNLSTETRELINEVAEDNPSLPAEELARLRAEVPNWVSAVGSALSGSHIKAKNMPLAEARDSLVTFRMRYETEHDNLEDKFRTLESTDRSFDANGQRSRSGLLSACETMTGGARNSERSISDLIRDDVVAEADEADASSFRSGLDSHVRQLVDHLERFQREVTDQIRQLEGVFRQEENVITMLGETRKSVTKFTAEINLDAATDMIEADEQASKTLAAEMPTTADRDDLLAYVGHATPDVRAHLTSYQAVFNKFRDAFGGRFIGPINDATAELYIENREWHDWAGQITACDAVGALRNLRDRNDGLFDANLDTITNPAAQSAFRDALLNAHDAIEAAIRAALIDADQLQNLARLEGRERLLARLLSL